MGVIILPHALENKALQEQKPTVAENDLDLCHVIEVLDVWCAAFTYFITYQRSFSLTLLMKGVLDLPQQSTTQTLIKNSRRVIESWGWIMLSLIFDQFYMQDRHEYILIKLIITSLFYSLNDRLFGSMPFCVEF